HAVHAHGRGGGAVEARRRDRGAVATRPAVLSELCVRNPGAAVGERASCQGWAVVGTALASVRDVERAISSLRIDPDTGAPFQRTSVMTHMAWVPEEWVEAAEDVL